ncbi:MAG TPA: hypothetical protein VGP69_17895, partial [Gaiellaceae bacterium]|nr:hypothetical protein [Gaiellaceae bacterium]
MPRLARQILPRLKRGVAGEMVTLLAAVVRGRKDYRKDVLAAARKLKLREARIDGRRHALRAAPGPDESSGPGWPPGAAFSSRLETRTGSNLVRLVRLDL